MNIVLNGNMNESSSKAGKGFYPNTELGIDLKLMTKEPGRMAVGEHLDGAITYDGEDPTSPLCRMTRRRNCRRWCREIRTCMKERTST